jgi:hypothetical protein
MEGLRHAFKPSGSSHVPILNGYVHRDDKQASVKLANRDEPEAGKNPVAALVDYDVSKGVV